jgi:hypothetical protein
MIRYLSHTEIDKEKWDDCIARSAVETLYPYSWYLDVVSPGWYALVMDDYKMVMPLTWKRAYGIRMLVQPLLTQQLGIFSGSGTDAESTLEFIRSISPKYLIVDICLNRENNFEDKSIRQESRHNYELDISDPARDPEKGYTTNTLRNVLKGKVSGGKIENITLEAYLDLKLSLPENLHLKKHRLYFERLYSCLLDRGRAGIFGLTSGAELHTAAILGYSETRTIYLNGCSSETGKEKRGMFVLMDHMIRLKQGEHLIFDFEGSSIPGVARFFEGFGGVRTVYPRIMRNPFQLLGITS